MKSLLTKINDIKDYDLKAIFSAGKMQHLMTIINGKAKCIAILSNDDYACFILYVNPTTPDAAKVYSSIDFIAKFTPLFNAKWDYGKVGFYSLKCKEQEAITNITSLALNYINGDLDAFN